MYTSLRDEHFTDFKTVTIVWHNSPRPKIIFKMSAMQTF